jgi:hypothetical protein
MSGIVLLVLLAVPARSETAEEWVALGTRVPVGIRIEAGRSPAAKRIAVYV